MTHLPAPPSVGTGAGRQGSKTQITQKKHAEKSVYFSITDILPYALCSMRFALCALPFLDQCFLWVGRESCLPDSE
jgi:hypothetical protein